MNIWYYIYMRVCYILLVGQNFVLHFNASFDMYWLDLICPNVMGFKLQQSPSSHGLRRSPRTRCSIHPLSPRSPTYRNLANLGEQAPRWQPPIHISDMQQRTTRKQLVVRDSKSDTYRKAIEATTSALYQQGQQGPAKMQRKQILLGKSWRILTIYSEWLPRSIKEGMMRTQLGTA